MKGWRLGAFWGETNRTLRNVAIAWAGLTLLVVASSILAYLWRGASVFRLLFDNGPNSNPHVTLLSITLVWLLFGSAIGFLLVRGLTPDNLFPSACFFALALLYVNVLRERPNYIDVGDYIQAASELAGGAHLHSLYIYPPFLATVLGPFARLGARVAFDVCWVVNALSLFAFFFLLRRTLILSEFSPRGSTLATFVFMLVNVPILRTLVCGQINLLVMDCILASILSYRRSRLLSAVCLAMAVHLKLSPIILLLAFLLEKDWRWMAWFVLALSAGLALTVVPYGIMPFYDVLHNLQRLYEIRDAAFRDNSIDSFVMAWRKFGTFDPAALQRTIFGAKVMLTLASLWTMFHCMKRRLFFDQRGPGAIAFNAIPVLLILMMLGSPIAWEHHPVFLTLSFLLILRGIETTPVAALYTTAYALTFLVPTFDFFPWSYGRLLGPLILLALPWALGRGPFPTGCFRAWNQWLEAIPIPAKRTGYPSP